VPTVRQAVDRVDIFLRPHLLLLICSCSDYDASFPEAILSLHRFKNCVLSGRSTPSTALSLWFRATLLRFASLLPVYFDRTQAFSSALYGYDTGLFMQGKTVETDWNAAVVELLRRQEKGGSPMAVALVLDASTAGTHHVERGLQFASLSPQGAADAGADDARHRWPAVYMRSTQRLTDAAQPSSRPTLARGSSGYMTSSSQGSMLQNWSIVGSSSSASLTSSVKAKAPLVLSKATVLEYAPDSGRVAWPHSDWNRLSVLLQNRQQQATHSDNPSADYGAISGENIEQRSRLAHASLGSMVSLDEASSLVGVASSFDKPSMFHICTVGDFLSLVAIVGSEGDEHRWRRRTGLTDEEIRAFLLELASQLRIARSFTGSSIPRGEQDGRMMNNLRASLRKSQTATPQRKAISADFSHKSLSENPSSFTDEAAQAILRDVKVAFGLRSVSPLAHDALRSTTTLSPASRRLLAQQASSLASSRFRLTPSQRSGVRATVSPSGQELSGPFSQSACDEAVLRLFLGYDLAPMFL
jgi:hypothetical protein